MYKKAFLGYFEIKTLQQGLENISPVIYLSGDFNLMMAFIALKQIVDTLELMNRDPAEYYKKYVVPSEYDIPPTYPVTMEQVARKVIKKVAGLEEGIKDKKMLDYYDSVKVSREELELISNGLDSLKEVILKSEDKEAIMGYIVLRSLVGSILNRRLRSWEQFPEDYTYLNSIDYVMR